MPAIICESAEYEMPTTIHESAEHQMPATNCESAEREMPATILGSPKSLNASAKCPLLSANANCRVTKWRVLNGEFQVLNANCECEVTSRQMPSAKCQMQTTYAGSSGD